MITIIHPSRSRPAKAHQTRMRWIERIGVPDHEFEYILSLDNDDPDAWKYNLDFPNTNSTIFRSDNRSVVDAINIPARFFSAYRNEPKDFLIVVSDDFDCFDGWGKRLNDLKLTGEWVLKTKDGIQPWLITLPIMSWDYFRKFNHVYHPDYFHCFADTEMTFIASMTDSDVISSISFPHNHHSITGKTDALTERNDATFESGKKIFVERKKKLFDLKPEEIRHPMVENVYSRMQ